MDDFHRRLLRRLVFRPESLSRNRNFDAFNDPALKRIRETARHLRSVVDELRKAAVCDVQVARSEQGWSVSVRRVRENATRRIMLSDEEFRLLAEHPAATALRRGVAGD